jgi:hypothetical protein
MSINFSSLYTVDKLVKLDNFSFAKDLVIPPAAPDAFKEAMVANANITGFTTTKGLDVVYNSNLDAENASKPKDISYQIMLEPLKAVSSNSLSNATVGASSNLAKAFTGASGEGVDNASKLSQDPGSIANPALKESTDAASKKLATTAFNEANMSEKASGNSLQATFGSRTIAANSLKFFSDSNIHTRTPHHLISTQDYHVQANNSIVEASSSKISNFGNKVTTVDGASIENVQSSVHISTSNRDVVSPKLKMVGTETIQTMGKNNISIADSNMVMSSGGSTEITSSSSQMIRAGSDINIISSLSPISPDEAAPSGGHALGNIKDTAQKLIEATSNSINIVSSHIISKNIISLTKDGTSQSTSEAFAIMAGKENYLSGAQVFSVATASGLSFYGNEDIGIITFGRKQFAGFPSPVPAARIPVLQDLPLIPALPSLPIAELDNCIPKKFKTERGAFERDTSLPTGPEVLLEQSKKEADEINKEKSSRGISTSIPPAPNVFRSGTQNKLNAKEGARNLSTSEKTSTSSDRSPGLTTSHEANKDQVPVASDCIDTEGISTPDVYPDLFSSTSYVFADFSVDEFNTSINFDDLFNANKPSIIPLTKEFSFLRENLSFLPTDIFTKITPEVFTSIISQPTREDLKKKSSETLSSLLNNEVSQELKADLDTVIDYLASNQRDSDLFFRAGDIALTSASIGLIPKLISLVASTYKKLPSIIKSGALSSYISFAQSTLSAVGVKLPPQLQSLVGLGKVISNPTRDNVISAVSGVVSSQLGNVIPGVPLDTLTNIISPLLSKPKVTNEEIEAALTQSLGSIPQIGTAVSTLAPIVKLAREGKYSEILSQGGITSIASVLLGSKNASQIQKIQNIFSSGKDLAKSLNSIPSLIKLMSGYKVPAINQIAIALNCLDLFNKIKSLISAVSSLDFSSGEAQPPATGVVSLITNSDTSEFVDNLPRYIQLINSIQSINLPRTPDLIREALVSPSTDQTIKGVLATLTQEASPEEIAALINMTLEDFEEPLPGCFYIPYLTIAESSIRIQSMGPREVVFSLETPELLTNNPYKLPQLGELIYVTVNYYTSQYGGLVPYSSEFQYTPKNIRLYVSSYNPLTNEGVALYEDPSYKMILKTNQETLYEYAVSSIGVNLFPQISDAYLVK